MKYSTNLQQELQIHYGPNHVPHWELTGATYHVCFRLHDSVPLSKRQEWLRQRATLAKFVFAPGMVLSREEQLQVDFLFSEKIDRLLDSGYGQCWLRQPAVADVVKNCLLHGNGKFYQLHAWCIMPNHIHVLLHIFAKCTLTSIVQRWKSFSAHQINPLLGRTGRLWQPDFYNRIVRTDDEYQWILDYIWENPTKAGFHDWPWRWRIF